MKRRKAAACCSASITVMVSLTILIVLSLLFSMVELSRVDALSAVASITADRAVDSAFSEYNKLLWDEYGVLYFDGGYGNSDFNKSNLERRITDNAVDDIGTNEVLSITRAATQISAYRLATDNGGRDFIGQACDRLWITAVGKSLDVFSEARNGIHISKGARDQHDGSEEKFYNALSKMNDAEEERDRKVREAKEAAERAKKNGEDPPDVPEVNESPEVVEFKSAARQIGSQMKNGITGLVLGKDAAVSQRTIKSQDLLSARTLNVGMGETAFTKSEYDGALQDVIFAEYLKEYFSSYCSVKDSHGMSYELEYILCGKRSDKENLESTLKKLLGLRLACNIASIYMTGNLHGIAASLAAELATALWVPALTVLFEILIIVAWAFVESVLDLRTLLDGGKIPVIKNAATWTSDLFKIAKCLDKDTKAKETPAGITYQGYINQLIYFENQETKAYRAMDMMEESLIISTLTPQAKMDNMISKASGDIELYSVPLFLSLVPLAQRDIGEYSFRNSFAFTYY